ncbi:MAG: elongation factor P, partial [Planctomycetes bacterium]|nr:elongation factor P [Planctomycetota bacterium]
MAVKGNSATGVKKDAKLETGHALKVPTHIGVGEKITVNTDTGEFVGRAKE